MPITAEQAVLLSTAREFWTTEQRRQRAAFNRLQMLKDDYEDLVIQEIREMFSPDTAGVVSKFINTSPNPFKSVITRISRIYQDSPKRIFTGPDKQVDRMEECYDQMGINTKMRKVNQYMNAMNEVVLQPVYRDGKLDLDILTPNTVSVRTNPRNPTVPVGVIINKLRERIPGESRLMPPEKYYTVWTDTEHFNLRNNEIEPVPGNPNQENPYGVLPFVFLHRVEPEDCFWDETSGDDLFRVTVRAGTRQTLLDYYFTWNSFKQLVIITEEEVPPGITVSPDKAIHIKGNAESGDSSAEILDFQIRLKELTQDTKEMISTVLDQYGVEMKSFSIQGVNEASGKSLRIRAAFLQQLWKDQSPTFRKAEQDLFELIKRILQVETGENFDQLEMDVEFAVPQTYDDKGEDLEHDTKLIEHDLADMVEIFMKRNPDYTNYDEARKKVKEIIKNNKELRDLAEMAIPGDEE